MDFTYVIAGFVPPGSEIGEQHRLSSPVIVKITSLQGEILRVYPETHERFNCEIYRRLASVDMNCIERNEGNSFAFVSQDCLDAEAFAQVLNELQSLTDQLSIDLTDFALLSPH